MRSSRTSSIQVTEPRQVTSVTHPGRPCESCVLCNKGNQSNYFHPKSWKDPLLLQRLQEFEPSLNIQPESCICPQCRNDVRKLGNDSIPTRWRKNSSVTVKNCYIHCCTNVDIKVTKLMERQAIVEFFACNTSDSCQSSENETEGIPLCSHHYMEWYRYNHPSHIKCKTCGKNIDHSSKSRPVPEPQILQQFLNNNTEFKDNLHPDD